MLLLMGTSAVTASAQMVKETGSDEIEKYERLVKKKQDLDEKKSNLFDQTKRLKADSVALSKTAKALENEIGKCKKDVDKLEQSKEYKEYLRLVHEKDSLNRVIQQKEVELGKSQTSLNADRERLKKKEEEVAKINEFEADFSKKVTAEINTYLDKPFADMKQKELEQFKTNYGKYSSNAEIKKALNRVDKVTEQKTFFEKMVDAVNSPYDRVKVDRIRTASMNNFTNLLPAQSQEVKELREQMQLFPDGLKKFKAIIDHFAGKRKSISNYSSFFDGDWNKYVNGIEHRGVKRPGHNINEIYAVPYLNGKLKALKAAYKKNDAVTIKQIEAEITGQLPKTVQSETPKQEQNNRK
jgi:hypothetical protein